MHITDHFTSHYSSFVCEGLSGRYFTADYHHVFLHPLKALDGSSEVRGCSVNGEDIHLLTMGRGPVKVLMWSQMHGNESTTTRALADLFQYLLEFPQIASELLDKLTLYIIPVLNPDGARAYTRVNAVNIDLNRDAQNLSQPESRVLRAVFEQVKPDYCFNLHDQRTIFSAGPVAKPATVSFLSPSFNEAREINATREVSMQLIAGMNKVLQERIPGQVGRYDDGFNLNCVGDTFTYMGVPTVLFESGHYQEDYQRNYTRECIAVSLITALELITTNTYDQFSKEDYLNIPENEKLFCDVLIPGVILVKDGKESTVDLCFMYKEVLRDQEVVFELNFEKWVPSSSHFGHKVLSLNAPVIYNADTEESLEAFATNLRKRLK
ncbi:M14 family metallopeptidase [Robertkochia sediminum]|uniref:M14 family metallopeptidase n=1 Tax=Robertkochia sediminum TaxID=2785326 RepID=UPI0019321E04|nr:M14 metallopeptidase family protein [Robertkochia sediminum]MBL7473486.1 peptidase M14 [Robertkochia sediminum]